MPPRKRKPHPCVPPRDPDVEGFGWRGWLILVGVLAASFYVLVSLEAPAVREFLRSLW